MTGLNKTVDDWEGLVQYETGRVQQCWCGHLLRKILNHRLVKICVGWTAAGPSLFGGFSSLHGDSDRSPGIQIGKCKMCRPVLKFMGDRLCESCERTADEAFKGGILNDLNHAVEVYLPNCEADVWPDLSVIKIPF